MRFFSRRVHKAVSAFDTIEISESHGVRYLHLGNNSVQSAMRLSAPNALELSYTQTMMAFLLFDAPPKDALMLGLGGGSLAKFLYHQFPDMRLCAVDIHPEVIRVAHQYFNLPHDEDRLIVVQADAAEFITHQRNWSAILLDGYDARCQVPALAEESFYLQCSDALADRGVLSVNLWGSDPLFPHYRQRLERVFDRQVITLAAEKRGNVIALAFKEPPPIRDRKQLKARSIELEVRYKLPFTRFLERLLPSADWLIS